MRQIDQGTKNTIATWILIAVEAALILFVLMTVVKDKLEEATADNPPESVYSASESAESEETLRIEPVENSEGSVPEEAEKADSEKTESETAGSAGSTEEKTDTIEKTTVYDGVDYSAVYDYDYYLARYPEVAATTDGDPEKTLAYFVETGLESGQQGNQAFDVDLFYLLYPEHRPEEGETPAVCYEYFIAHPDAVASQEALDALINSTVPEDTTQLVLVHANADSTAYITHWVKNGVWQCTKEMNGYVGTNGVGETQEGISTTPIGTYPLSFAFGTEEASTFMTFREITKNSYWISNTSDSDYNTWQERSGSASIDEHLIACMPEYKYAMAIDYDHGVGGGSAFFLHVAAGKPTAGCVAVSEEDMQYFFETLDNTSCIANVNTVTDMTDWCGESWA